MIATATGADLPQYLPGGESGDVARVPVGSDEESPIDHVDSWLASRPLLDQAVGPTIHNLSRSESASGPTAAEQVFGEIASRIEVTRQDGRVDFRLQLDPPGLGTVHVHLTATENAVNARLYVDDAGAHDVVAGQLERLRDSLADLGVSLDLLSFSGEGGGSRGTRHWRQPEAPSNTLRIDAPRLSKYPTTSRARLPKGVIDVVV